MLSELFVFFMDFIILAMYIYGMYVSGDINKLETHQ